MGFIFKLCTTNLKDLTRIYENSFKVFLFTLAVTFISCENNRKDVDISQVQTKPLEILRLDQDLFNVKPEAFDQEYKRLKAKYGTYYDSFIYNIINNGGIADSVNKSLNRFITDKDMRKVNEKVNAKFTNERIKKIEDELNTSFKYFKYHFPNNNIPGKIITYISGFNFNITTLDSTLGVGLDMYLGKDESYYQMLQWPRYKVRCMEPEYINVEAMRGWLIHSFDNKEPGNNLLSHMIFFGKLYYANEMVCPFASDSVIISYSDEQMKYCLNFEKELWSYFTSKDLLYTSDMKKIVEYTTEGPFTSAISKECPPRIAHWIGWQIVRKYMSKSKDKTLSDLMNENDPNKILSASKYKP
jgi:hypothetical protein